MKKYTKKQILEAISFWESVLERSQEDNTEKLVKAAKALGVDVSAFSGVMSESERVDESTASGFITGMLAAMLGLCAAGKIANSLDGKFTDLAADGKFAREMKVIDNTLADVKSGLGKIEDALYAVSNKIDFNDPSLEDIVDGVKAEDANQKIHAQFEKIMAED